MVKFAKHVEAYLDGEHRGSDLYVVPYQRIRDAFIQNSGDIPTRLDFEAEWRRALKRASDDFGSAVVRLWREVFDAIRSNPESRGAVPDRALRMYVAAAGPDAASGLLSTVREIHSTALTNAEALRKLAKKYDKRIGEEGGGDDSPPASSSLSDLSATLLPEVYAANFTVGQPTLESGLALLRTQLGLDDDDADLGDVECEEEAGGGGSPHLVRYRRGGLANQCRIFSSEDMDAGEQSFLTGPGQNDRREVELVEKRRSELSWLRDLVRSIPPPEIGGVVSHRGFHWPSDRSDTRPLENSLEAYEAAWTSGIHLCECDIALTKDERLVLCHDEDFSRLALDPTSEMATRKVQDLTLRELFSIPLKTGSRPPLLLDVLRSAQAIGGDARLVVEIKPGNPEAGTALARLFVRNPDLCARCAVVMSFDAFAMHSLRRELRALKGSAAIGGMAPKVGSVSFPTSMSLGNVGLRIDSLAHSPEEDEKDDDRNGDVRTPSIITAPSGLVQHKHYGTLIPPMRPRRVDSADHFGVGLSVSFRDFSYFHGDEGGGTNVARKDSFDFAAGPYRRLMVTARLSPPLGGAAAAATASYPSSCSSPS